MATSKLPPLPGSDEQSLRYNNRKARDFWGENVIEKIELKEQPKCDHYFNSEPGGVRCKKCHFGLKGPLNLKKGKLYYKDRKLPL